MSDQSDDQSEVEQPIIQSEPEQSLRQTPSERTCIGCKSTSKLFKTKNHKTCIECCSLRPQKSEKQIEAFKKAREKRQENISKRKQDIQELETKTREEYDKKIVSKAISIKKKMIKKNAELEEISDDDTPLEEVLEIARKKTAKPKKPKRTVTYQEPESEQVEYAEPPQYTQQVRAYSFA